MNVNEKAANWLGRLHNSPLRSKIKEACSSLPKLPKKALWIAGLVIVLAIAAGLIYYKFVYLAAQTAAEPTLQTAVVRQGSLVISATGTGTLISKDEVNLAFEADAKVVTEVDVKVGDQVKTGDLLAKVDDTDLKIPYIQAKRALQELTSASAIASAQASMATAQSDLDDAVQHLEYVISPPVMFWENKVALAKQAVEEAQTKVDASPTDKDAQAALTKAEATLKSAQTNLAGAQYSYEHTYLKNNFTVTGIDSKTHQLVKYVAEPSKTDILSARAAVAEAQATVKEAGYLYAALTGGEVPDDATGSSLTDLEQAKLDIETTKAALDGASLYAPIAGTVMSVDISVNDTSNSGTTVITISDLSHPYLEVFLDESDWGNVKTGAEADVTFDILPDQTYKGIVTQVDPGLYTQSNSSVVRAYVQLANTDTAGLSLPLGTTASVEVIGSKAENAILVPVEALHKTETGDYTVFVVENGTPKLRVVKVGIQDLINAEVTSGLAAGDIVTTGVTETK
jgi:HlyD family secretion protein